MMNSLRKKHEETPSEKIMKLALERDKVYDRCKSLSAEIVFNDQLLIRGVRICEGENGLYISYPFPFHPTTGEDGQPRSSVFPITKVLRDHVEAVVLEKYQDTINNEKVTIK